MTGRLNVLASAAVLLLSLSFAPDAAAQRGGGGGERGGGGRGGRGEQPGVVTPQAGQGRQQAQAPDMLSFFVTSTGMKNGGNLGGLEGADKYCQMLADEAGSTGNKTWRAYLSTQASGNQPAVNARDRIGKGPWFNADGAQVAENLIELHGEGAAEGIANIVNKTVALTEVGNLPRQDNQLTGSKADGKAYTDGMDHTCHNWTSNSEGSVRIGSFGAGQSQRGSDPRDVIPTWNSSTNKECTPQVIPNSTLYCFAIMNK